MTFKQQIANFITGNLTTSQLPQVACAGLLEGLDSESLTILAGMSSEDNAFEIEDYFTRALKELRLKLPGRRDAAIELAKYYADLILANEIEPIEGVHQIIRKALDSYNFFQETREFTMDSINFETAYGLYWKFEDLRSADAPWSDERSNDELMADIKKEIIREVGVWRTSNVFHEG